MSVLYFASITGASDRKPGITAAPAIPALTMKRSLTKNPMKPITMKPTAVREHTFINSVLKQIAFVGLGSRSDLKAITVCVTSRPTFPVRLGAALYKTGTVLREVLQGLNDNIADVHGCSLGLGREV